MTEREKSFGLNWDETPFRGYDAQLGRFHQVDLMADLIPGINPYQYAFNNPIYFNDPSGAFPVPKFLQNLWDKISSSVTDFYGNRQKVKKQPKKGKRQKKSGSQSSSSSNSNNDSNSSESSSSSNSNESNSNGSGSGSNPSDVGNNNPSTQDIALATSGTVAEIGKIASGVVIKDRTGITSGKLSPNSPKVFNKKKASTTKGGFTVLSWAIIAYSTINTERQFRNNEISLGRRKFNHQNNLTGVFFPQVAIPIATGDYLGQRYSNEINATTVEEGGIIFEGMKSTLEFLSIPTEPKEVKQKE